MEGTETDRSPTRLVGPRVYPTKTDGAIPDRRPSLLALCQPMLTCPNCRRPTYSASCSMSCCMLTSLISMFLSVSFLKLVFALVDVSPLNGH